MDTKRIFDTIVGASTSYAEAVSKAFSGYQAEREKARNEASKYKDETAIFNDRMAVVKGKTLQEISAAEDSFRKVLGEQTPKLKEALGTYLLSKPSPIYTEVLGLYRDYAMPLSRSEIEALLSLNGGSAVGLGMLSSVLEKSHSEFCVNFTTPAEFEKDLSAIESLADGCAHYVPLSAHSLGCELYAGSDWGSSVRLLTNRGAFESKTASLGEMASRWNGPMTVLIDKRDEVGAEEYLDRLKDAATAAQVIEDKTAQGLAQARQIGKVKAEGTAQAELVRGIYSK